MAIKERKFREVGNSVVLTISKEFLKENGLNPGDTVFLDEEKLRASAFGEEVYPSIYEKAAILLIQLIKKHPFHNANKRTAFLATFVFLKINGQLLAIDQKDAVNLVVYIATYDKDFDQLKYEVINTIKTHTQPI
ncbi:TPA: type II toxin-antitoxin system death-on-curing family toxin [Enterococcus faecium]